MHTCLPASGLSTQPRHAVSREHNPSAKSQTRESLRQASELKPPSQEIVDSNPEIAESVEVLSPLHPKVIDTLNKIHLECHPSLTADQVALKRVEEAIKCGQRLQEHVHNLITRICNDIVIKTIPGRDTIEVCALRHINDNTDIPVPRLLGAIASTRETHIMMSFVKGDLLQDVWPKLLDCHKMDLKQQMEDILRKLRGSKLPSQYYGCGSPPVCRDIRTDNRLSKPYITSEEDFNAFVLSNPKDRVSQIYIDFIQKEVLTTNHNVVMTHGDFTPRNLIVDKSTDGSMVIVGVIDWEASGAYPDYWEYVKMLHTVSANEADDWLQYLPQLNQQDAAGEWAKQLLIDRISR